MKKYIILLIVFLFAIEVTISFGQIKDIGLPFINNFSRTEYNAETQNWAIDQDEQGIMYFANNQGLLSFNGNDWKTTPLPNGSIIRSIFCYNGKIYAGGYNEFGYFEKDAFGDISYFSISDDLQKTDKSFGEIWRIFKTNDGIIFQSYLNIFIFSNSSMKVLEPKSRFGFSYLVDSTLYITDNEFGLYTIKNKKLVPIWLEEKFFYKNEITFIINQPDNSLAIGTVNNGIFLLKNNKLEPWKFNVNDEFIKNQIYTGIKLNEYQIAIGTIQNGIYIVDFNGNEIVHLNRSKGLQNNTVLSLFSDKYKNLWLGLDNGIDLLEVNSPISIMNYSYNIEASYTSIIHNNILYIGTNQGLFAKPISDLKNSLTNEHEFKKVDGTLGQVWSLKILKNQLFCGHNFGSFLINKYSSKIISNIPGGWDFKKIPWNNDYVIAGTYNGLNLFKYNTALSKWENNGMIKGMKESCKDLLFDDENNLWITHGLNGIYKLVLSANLKGIDKLSIYESSNGLPSLPYSFAPINNTFLILASDILYEYNHLSDSFLINKKYTSLFEGIKDISRIIEDENGDIWFFTNSNLGVLRKQEDGTYNKIIKPFYRIHQLFISGSFENIYPIDENNVLIGSQEGILHYSTENHKDFKQKYNTYLSEISIKTRKNDTINNSKLVDKKIPISNNDINLSHKYNSIAFKFFTPFYEAPNETKHSYRLVGFDETWSAWTNTNFKEYTNLHEGKYTFEVKAKNIYNNESMASKFSFTIHPPFYRTRVAYAFYVLLIIAIIVINIIYVSRKIQKTRDFERKKLITKEKEFIEEAKISEQKIEELEKEKIKSEMRLKNIELANSTMNLVQKNKLLNNVKKELGRVSDNAQVNSVKVDIKHLMTKIDKDINNDKNFKLFDKYFDRVHQDFVHRIKEKHQNLTPKDLRLCAYLRMNLTTKEIAPLMNVSIRGLEISRYRLRKKLDLERDDNLVDYIMNI